MKRSLLMTAAVILLSQGALAGATNAYLECVSASGKTKVSSLFPGDFTESGLIFSIEGVSNAYADQDLVDAREMNNGRIYEEYAHAKLTRIVSQDNLSAKANPSLLVGVESVEGDQAFLVLQSIPGTIKMKRTANGQRGTLSATVQGLDPRTGGASPVINLKCNYKYEI
ncbi:hypothetical protein AZI86_00225 [Bdellovibrio bacteriovorus]|uniref:Phage tail protein n=1 Tax=Bdellovibrio bacteriovorus TaxID=959 RepID=A0A150WM25_BDEBC|nr:hypothetical protein [Bdellovibrio bacteriovorus]KYG65541.1 hypothetical protein AZI86_00225 [Bdellovibrio bacteriovorus]